MEEAYTLCDEIAIMDHGRIIAQGMPDQLLRSHFDSVAITLPRQDFSLQAQDVPWPTYEKGAFIEIQTPSVNETLKFLIEHGTNLAHLNVRTPQLEDLFIALTGAEIRS